MVHNITQSSVLQSVFLAFVFITFIILFTVHTSTQSPLQGVNTCSSVQVATVTSNGLVCTSPPYWTYSPVPPATPTQMSTTLSVRAPSFFYTSDVRHKENITPLENALEGIAGLRGYLFTLISSGQDSIGLIAQEVEEVFPQLVSEDEEGYKSVDYASFVAVLIEAVNGQQAEIEELRAEVAALRAEVRGDR